MADNTKIEWTDATWSPITGCSVVSPGCTNCYAMRLAHHESRAGLTRDTKAGPVWTGEVRFNEQWLDQPLRWNKPRLIFVCAHGDLFAEGVPDEWIDKVFAVMALAPQHTFQVLTKRAKRMREYLTSRSAKDERGHPAEDIRIPMTSWLATPSWRRRNVSTAKHVPLGKYCASIEWPLPNAWLGVSVEDQKRADERIPDLLATPAAVRWISAEPLLGPVDLTRIAEPDDEKDGVIDALLGCNWIEQNVTEPDYRPCRPGHEGRVMGRYVTSSEEEILANQRLNWVVVGGESGPCARVWPGFEDACRSLRDQCRSAGVPFFMKQMQGARKATMPPIPDDLLVREIPR